MGINKLNLLLTVLAATSIVSTVLGQSLISSLSVTFCGFVKGIKSIIGLVAICLFLIGGVMYSIAHFLPSSLDYRKNLIGWSQAMIVGACIGLVIVVLAQPLVSLIGGFSTAAGGAALPNTSCV
ncbi:MAG: hypothetical protein ABSD68_03895 [Candidatus Micrarchaeales archaeon]